MLTYAGRRLRFSVRLCFAIFRCWEEKFVVRWFYWSAQTIRVVSQIYREQNNRGDVSQSENTDVTRTDKTDWKMLLGFEMAKGSTFQ